MGGDRICRYTIGPASTLERFIIFIQVGSYTCLNGSTETRFRLPAGYYALAEQHGNRMIGDLLTLQAPASKPVPGPRPGGAVAAADAPPRVARRIVMSQTVTYRALRETLTIRHVSDHRVIAIIEIVSPANKDRPKSVEEFVAKILSALRCGVHVLVVDLFRPGLNDSEGIHEAIGDFRSPEDEEVEPEDPYTFASYLADEMPEAILSDLDLGSPLPETPLFLDSDSYVNIALEPTYQAAVRGVPEFWRKVIEGDRDVDLTTQGC
jgi:hypothetical protein